MGTQVFLLLRLSGFWLKQLFHSHEHLPLQYWLSNGKTARPEFGNFKKLARLLVFKIVVAYLTLAPPQRFLLSYFLHSASSNLTITSQMSYPKTGCSRRFCSDTIMYMPKSSFWEKMLPCGLSSLTDVRWVVDFMFVTFFSCYVVREMTFNLLVCCMKSGGQKL